MINIDKECFKYSIQALANMKDTNIIDKAIGVLAAQGPFALYLYLKKADKKKDEYKENVLDAMKNLLTDIMNLDAKKPIDKILLDISEDLDNLILAKQALEQMLTYMRYGAKANAS
jgi:hypothetical protein